eukprot:6212010-Pleurochrysis_carterae.AAC.4
MARARAHSPSRTLRHMSEPPPPPAALFSDATAAVAACCSTLPLLAAASSCCSKRLQHALGAGRRLPRALRVPRLRPSSRMQHMRAKPVSSSLCSKRIGRLYKTLVNCSLRSGAASSPQCTVMRLLAGACPALTDSLLLCPAP